MIRWAIQHYFHHIEKLAFTPWELKEDLSFNRLLSQLAAETQRTPVAALVLGQFPVIRLEDAFGLAQACWCPLNSPLPGAVARQYPVVLSGTFGHFTLYEQGLQSDASQPHERKKFQAMLAKTLKAVHPSNPGLQKALADFARYEPMAHTAFLEQLQADTLAYPPLRGGLQYMKSLLKARLSRTVPLEEVRMALWVHACFEQLVVPCLPNPTPVTDDGLYQTLAKFCKEMPGNWGRILQAGHWRDRLQQLGSAVEAGESTNPTRWLWPFLAKICKQHWQTFLSAQQAAESQHGLFRHSPHQPSAEITRQTSGAETPTQTPILADQSPYWAPGLQHATKAVVLCPTVEMRYFRAATSLNPAVIALQEPWKLQTLLAHDQQQLFPHHAEGQKEQIRTLLQQSFREVWLDLTAKLEQYPPEDNSWEKVWQDAAARLLPEGQVTALVPEAWLAGGAFQASKDALCSQYNRVEIYNWQPGFSPALTFTPMCWLKAWNTDQAEKGVFVYSFLWEGNRKKADFAAASTCTPDAPWLPDLPPYCLYLFPNSYSPSVHSVLLPPPQPSEEGKKPGKNARKEPSVIPAPFSPSGMSAQQYTWDAVWENIDTAGSWLHWFHEPVSGHYHPLASPRPIGQMAQYRHSLVTFPLTDSQGLQRVQAHYGKQLAQQQTLAELQAGEAFTQQLGQLGNFTRNLPVLHKFTLQMQQMLETARPKGKLKATHCHTLLSILADLQAKVQQLLSGARERRSLFEQTLAVIAAIREGLVALQTLVQQLETKREALTAENLGYYLYGLFHHPAYQASQWYSLPNPVVPLFREFWAMAECGKSLSNLHSSLPPALSVKPVAPAGKNWKIEGEGGKVIFKDQTEWAIPPMVLQGGLLGQPLLAWWLTAMNDWLPTESGKPDGNLAGAFRQMMETLEAIAEVQARLHTLPLETP
jgi:hypothetical protein